eukprot:4169870-Pyramimonas_sp.AAC.1
MGLHRHLRESPVSKLGGSQTGSAPRTRSESPRGAQIRTGYAPKDHRHFAGVPAEGRRRMIPCLSDCNGPRMEHKLHLLLCRWNCGFGIRGQPRHVAVYIGGRVEVLDEL